MYLTHTGLLVLSLRVRFSFLLASKQANSQTSSPTTTTSLSFVLRNPRSPLQGARPDEGTLAEVRGMEPPSTPLPFSADVPGYI